LQTYKISTPAQTELTLSHGVARSINSGLKIENFFNPTRLLIAIVFIGIVGMGINDAYAASGVSSAVANDPDDVDAVYSTGDIIAITFPAATNATNNGVMTNAEIIANFTFSASDIDSDTLSGLWDGTSTTLTLTIVAIGGSTPPVIDTETVNYDPIGGAHGIGYSSNNTEFTAGTVTLTGDFGLFVALKTNNGGGCSGDCSPPTLGINEKFRRVVENGFTYNENTINVERYFTPYPLITVNVGVENKAVFKIYENLGPSNVRHFELDFGLDVGQAMGTSNAMIVWSKSHDGTETVTLVDPHNALDNVRVLTTEGKCKTDSNTNDCLIVTVFHTFREPLDFDMVGTNVWDYRRNAWQNFYNHGVHIEGESLNPPDEYVGIHEANLIHIFETGKNTAVDEAGNTWTFDKIWTMDYIPKGKISDGYSKHGIDRNNAWFDAYKEGQNLLANELLEQLCQSCPDKEFAEINNIFAYEYPDATSRHEDIKLQNDIIKEILRAKLIFDQLY